MVIPTINCPDFECVKKRIGEIETFSNWTHIDVADGKFAKGITWSDPNQLKSLDTQLNIEVHLMVEGPDDIIESWLMAGAKRVIVHFQTIRDVDIILELCGKYGADAVLSLDPTTDIRDAEPYFNKFQHFQVLTVKPGPSGQEFGEEALDKIKFLRQKMPDVTIEVDGGIAPDTAKLAKEAGANIFAAASYIFNHRYPKTAFKILSSV